MEIRKPSLPRKTKETRRGLATPVPTPTKPLRAPQADEARLAAIAVDLNVRLRSADMAGAMQERAFRCTRALLDSSSSIAASGSKQRPNPTRLALFLKKEFDIVYGPAWHCIVGKSFGSYVTHSSGGFVYFSVDNLCFLLFKTEVQPVVNKSRSLLKIKQQILQI